jgi:putative ABC transport system permease protein
MLALAGGVVGLLLYWWLTMLMRARVTYVEITPDLATVAFTAAFALGTGILFGLSPALHATRGGVSLALKDSGTGATHRSGLQRGFIVAQIVFTQPLLVALAMLLVLVVQEQPAYARDPVAEHIVAARFGLSGGAGSPATRERKVRDVMDRVASMPGVSGVVPNAAAFQIADLTTHPADRDPASDDARSVRAHLEGTAPGYFQLLSVPIVRGRGPQLGDTAGAEIAVVMGSDLAHELWGTGDPLGRRLRQASRGSTRRKDLVVVGVFDAERPTTRGSGTRLYTAYGKHWRKDSFLIRTHGPADALLPAVRQLTRSDMPEIALYGLKTLAQQAREDERETLQVSASAAGAGMLALLLASIGLYGVVALAVGQRRREIGVRMALGARPGQVIALFFSSGVRLSVIGLVLGLPLSMIALRLVASTAGMPKVSMPVVGASIAIVVLVVASIATWIPARHAARVDPMIALRVE